MAYSSAIVSCVSVCNSWRKTTKEIIVKTPEESVGSREFPIQCFIKRDKASSVYPLYFGMTPSENERDKLLLAAKRTRRATGPNFVISLVADDFSQASNTYVGKLRSNFLGTKFFMYDSQPLSDAAIQQHGQLGQGFHAKQVSPGLPVCNDILTIITYEPHVNRTRGPRKMHCAMHFIPLSSVQKGGSAPTPKSFPKSFDEKPISSPLSKEKEPAMDISSSDFSESAVMVSSQEPLVLKNKAPRWHEQLQCWC